MKRGCAIPANSATYNTSSYLWNRVLRGAQPEQTEDPAWRRLLSGKGGLAGGEPDGLGARPAQLAGERLQATEDSNSFAKLPAPSAAFATRKSGGPAAGRGWVPAVHAPLLAGSGIPLDCRSLRWA